MAGVIVNQGQLQVNATLTGTISPTAPLNVPVPTVVNATGTLAGTGAVPGPVVIKSGGTIAPGVGSNIATFTTGGANFQPGGTYNFKYNPGTSSPVPGTDNDLLTSAIGGLDLSSLTSVNRFVVNLVPAVSATPPGSAVTYTAGTFATILLPPGVPGPDVTSLFTFTGLFLGTPTAAANSGVLTFQFTPVPEPGLVLLACAAAAGLVARRRTGSPCTAK
jgi:hypothetical protein